MKLIVSVMEPLIFIRPPTSPPSICSTGELQRFVFRWDQFGSGLTETPEVSEIRTQAESKTQSTNSVTTEQPDGAMKTLLCCCFLLALAWDGSARGEGLRGVGEEFCEWGPMRGWMRRRGHFLQYSFLFPRLIRRSFNTNGYSLL